MRKSNEFYIAEIKILILFYRIQDETHVSSKSSTKVEAINMSREAKKDAGGPLWISTEQAGDLGFKIQANLIYVQCSSMGLG